MASIAGGRSRDGSSSVLVLSSAVVIGYPWFPSSSRSRPPGATEGVCGFVFVVAQPLGGIGQGVRGRLHQLARGPQFAVDIRSEEHTSELQSRENLVCRLLLEKKQNET